VTLGDYAEAVRTYCLLRGGSITSWGRTTRHNTRVGGVKNSAHRFFFGADVVYDFHEATMTDANRFVEARRLGLKIIAEGDHDHLQPYDWEAG